MDICQVSPYTVVAGSFFFGFIQTVLFQCLDSQPGAALQATVSVILFFSFRFGFLSFLSKVFVIIILLLLLSIQLFNHYRYDCIVIIIIITGHSITIAMVIVIVLLFDRMLFLSYCF